MNMARQGMFLSEGIAGIMYLACGVIFPLSVLPDWFRWLGLILPPTWWLEGMRRCLLGSSESMTQLRSLPGWEHPQILGMLTLTTVILFGISQVFFRWSERRAWRHGRIEETTGV